jgi:hypothetical protein
MARRSRNLAGLAALGALGVMASRGLYKKPGEELAPVEYRGTDRPPEMPRASVESRPSTVRGDMSAADLYADAAAREALASPDEDFPRAGRTLAAPVRQQPSDLQGMFEGLGPLADTGGMGRSEVTAADQSQMGPVVPAAVTAAGSRPPATTARPPTTTARPPAAAPAARAPTARAPASNVARGTNRAATVGPRSTGVGGATIEDMERQQEYMRMVRKANELAKSGTPYGTQTDASALTYYRSKARPSTAQGGRGSARGATAQELVEARRGREANTSRFKGGGAVKASPKKMASAGVSSASKRADGIAQRGKTRGKVY